MARGKPKKIKVFRVEGDNWADGGDSYFVRDAAHLKPCLDSAMKHLKFGEQITITPEWMSKRKFENLREM